VIYLFIKKNQTLTQTKKLFKFTSSSAIAERPRCSVG